MAHARVLLGGSFACDDGIAHPVQVLLQETLQQEPVEVEWLGYGSAVDLASLKEPLQRASPDLVILLVRVSDLQTAHPELQAITASTDLNESRFLEQLREYENRLDRLATPPLVVLFCPSPPPPSSVSETLYKHQETELCRAIQSLQCVSCRPSSDAIEFFHGDKTPASPLSSAWYDATRDKREHAPFTQSMLYVLALRCVRQIARLWIRSPKKVIVLDCDNTLWGGAVADLGSARIELSDRFLALQRFVVRQQQRGVLLGLCSKNICQDVDAVFQDRADDMVLHKDQHIVISKINWHPKSHNLKAIAQELQLGLDAFVFVDDNAVECHEVASALPMVSVVHVPDEFDSTFLSTQWVFDTPLAFRATEEDSARTQLYQENAQRHALATRAPSQAAFLSSLGIRIHTERLVETNTAAFARVLQLHQRTNTFNVATTFSRALASEKLTEYVTTHWALASTVTDRYGHYGLVCATLFRVIPAASTTVVVVDSFLMSCRSLNRGVEHAMVKKIAEMARENGAETIQVAWEPTVRNDPVRMFFAALSISVFVTVEGECVTRREDKIEQSANVGGWWRLYTSDALKISFLREQHDQEESQAQHVAIPWRLQLQTYGVQLAKAVLHAVMRWMPRTWFTRLLAWVNKLLLGGKRLISNDRSQLICKPNFHSRAQLDAFMNSSVRRKLPPHTEIEGRTGVRGESEPETETESDEAFRLRVRHETKLRLLNHVTSDAPRVVWASQRSDDVRVDGDNCPVLDSRSTDTLQQFHRPCVTPSCAAQVYWASDCALQRCRTCCYRVQRLLTRATSETVHTKARAHAWASLADDFAFTSDGIRVKEEWCRAHTNDRRRK